MFGSLGIPELLFIFVIILVVFGPRRIPEIGRTLGKALGEFRRTTDDLKSTIEREVRLEELKKITPPSLESLYTPSESVSRSEPLAGSDAAAEETAPEIEELQPSHGPFAEPNDEPTPEPEQERHQEPEALPDPEAKQAAQTE